MQRTQVFISYSHADAEYLGRLKVHMRPFERLGHVELWADSRITPGDRWKQEIASAMDRAAIAVLLVSADFLASDFVAENELPPLLEAAQREGVRILPVILKPCAFGDIPSLSQFQGVNDPQRPLVALTEDDREQIWYDLAVTVRQQLQHAAAAAAAERPTANEHTTSTLESLVEKNKITNRDFLVGAQEAAAFDNKEFVRLHQSTLRKVDILANIVERAANDSLITNATWRERYGFHPSVIVELVKEHWVYSLLGLFALIFSLARGWALFF